MGTVTLFDASGATQVELATVAPDESMAAALPSGIEAVRVTDGAGLDLTLQLRAINEGFSVVLVDSLSGPKLLRTQWGGGCFFHGLAGPMESCATEACDASGACAVDSANPIPTCRAVCNGDAMCSVGEACTEVGAGDYVTNVCVAVGTVAGAFDAPMSPANGTTDALLTFPDIDVRFTTATITNGGLIPKYHLVMNDAAGQYELTAYRPAAGIGSNSRGSIDLDGTQAVGILIEQITDGTQVGLGDGTLTIGHDLATDRYSGTLDASLRDPTRVLVPNQTLDP